MNTGIQQQMPGNSTQPGEKRILESNRSNTQSSSAERWIALALFAAVLAAGVFEQFSQTRLDYAKTFAPFWIPIAAAIFALAGFMDLNGSTQWLRIRPALRWSGLLLMVWTSNGLPFDLLRLTPLMPLGVDWPGLVTRALALAATIVLARILLALPATPAPTRPAIWYGYAAFVLALPYPVLRICWAFGGMIGITIPGAAGVGFAPLIIAIPWMLAAAVSLFLVLTPRWMPRRLLLVAGWTATAIVAMIGPMACWTVITKYLEGTLSGPDGMKMWVPCLFYSSWFLWSIAACAATRSYQLRSAGRIASPDNEKKN
jgi:hypothetical protein